MKLDRHKIDIAMSRNGISSRQLAILYGCSPTRIYTILNCANVRPTTAAKLTKALGVDVSEILADE